MTPAALYATSRILLGGGLVAVPRLAARPWLGHALAEPDTRDAVRLLGIRDLAIGWGLLDAAGGGRHRRAWLLACLAVDAADAVVAADRARRTRRGGPALMAMAATGGALAALWLLRRGTGDIPGVGPAGPGSAS